MKAIAGTILLIFSMSSVCVAADEKKSEEAVKKFDGSSCSKSQSSFCNKVSKMIKDGTIDKHTPEYEAPSGPDPRGADYLNLDIDGDSLPDKVTVSSGSEGESLLVAQLSSGGEYDLDEDGFTRIVKIQEQICALVTYWEWHRQPDGSRKGKKIGYRLYNLTKHEAQQVCDKIDP